MNFSIEEKDLLVMKLVHYFIVKKNYSPVIIRGIDNEIWLENKEEKYNIIRIVTKHIHNSEQFNYDMLRTRNIIDQIKRKTFTFSMNTLSVFTDVEYRKDIIESYDKNFSNVVVEHEKDIYENDIIMSVFPKIREEIIKGENNIELFDKITMEISKKNTEETEKREKMIKQRKPILTYLLIIINVIIFALMYMYGNGSEDTNTLVNFGANYIPLVKSGEYYRIITSAFLHIGILHLLFNMYALFVIGTQIEYLYGRFKYFFIYIFSAIMGSLFTVALSSSNTVSAGASGAIFGLLGSMLYFGYNYRGYIGNSIINQVIPVILLNVVIGFTTPGIGNAAHIGGLIGGYIISMMLGIDSKDETKSKINGFILTVALTIFMIYIGFIK